MPHVSSTVYSLPVFCNQVFLRHPPCSLHQNVLGLLPRLVLFFGIKHGKSWCDNINIKFKNNMKYHGLKVASNGLYRFGNRTSTLPNGIAVVKYTGDVWTSVALVAVVLFHNEFETDIEMELLVEFLHFFFLVQENCKVNEKTLADLIYKVKQLWHQVFPPLELDVSEKNKYSYKFVNFDTWDAWPKVRNFLGPSILYSAQLWEILCQPLRRGRFGNNKAPERDALKKTAQLKLIEWQDSEHPHSQSDKNSYTFEMTKNTKKDNLQTQK